MGGQQVPLVLRGPGRNACASPWQWLDSNWHQLHPPNNNVSRVPNDDLSVRSHRQADHLADPGPESGGQATDIPRNTQAGVGQCSVLRRAQRG